MPPKKSLNWTHNRKEITDIPQMPKNTYGFVYQITIELDGKPFYYIGRKNLKTVRKVKLGKKELEQIKDKRLKKYKIVEKESDWKTYTGSNKALNTLITQYGVEKLKMKKEILEYCFSELELKFKEVKQIICSGAMESTEYFNDNVSIKQIGTLDFNKK